MSNSSEVSVFDLPKELEAQLRQHENAQVNAYAALKDYNVMPRLGLLITLAFIVCFCLGSFSGPEPLINPNSCEPISTLSLLQTTPPSPV